MVLKHEMCFVGYCCSDVTFMTLHSNHSFFYHRSLRNLRKKNLFQQRRFLTRCEMYSLHTVWLLWYTVLFWSSVWRSAAWDLPMISSKHFNGDKNSVQCEAVDLFCKTHFSNAFVLRFLRFQIRECRPKGTPSILTHIITIFHVLTHSLP